MPPTPLQSCPLTALCVGIARAALLAVTLTPLVEAGWPPALAGVWPDLYYPSVSARNLLFRGLVQLAVLAWAIAAWRTPRYRGTWSAIAITGAVLLSWMALVDSVARDPTLAWLGNYERMGGWLGAAHLWAMFWVARAVFDRPRWWWRWAAAAVSVAAVVAVLAVVQLWWARGGSGWGLFERWGRPGSNSAFRATACLGNAVFLASYLLVHGLLAAALASGARQHHVALRRWLTLVAIACLVSAALSRTRAGNLALAAAAIPVFLAVLRGRVGRRTAVVGAVALVAALAAVATSERAWLALGLNRFKTTTQAVGERGAVWRCALGAVAARPMGHGHDGFTAWAEAAPGLDAGGRQQWVDRPHNAPLRWAVEGGLLGLALHGAVLALLARALARRPRRGRQWWLALVVGHFAFHLLQPEALTTAALWFALLAWADRPHPGAPRARTLARPVLAVAGVLALAGLWLHTVPGWRGAHALAEVVQLRQRLAARTAEGASATTADELALARWLRNRAPPPAFARAEHAEELAQLALTATRAGLAPRLRQPLVEIGSAAIETELASAEPATARQLLLAGELALRTGRTQAARELLDAALARTPRRRSVVRAAAAVRHLQGAAGEAIELLLPLVHRDPHDADSQALLLPLLIEAGHFDELEQLLVWLGKRQVLPGPEIVEHIDRTGQSHRLKPALDAVLEHVRRRQAAPARRPTGPDLALLYAYTGLLAGDRPMAETYLARFRELWPPTPRTPPPRAILMALRSAGWHAELIEWLAPMVEHAERDVRRGLAPVGAARWVDELVAAYEAAGRSEDAAKLRRRADGWQR